jgi:hypothetical protein
MHAHSLLLTTMMVPLRRPGYRDTGRYPGRRTDEPLAEDVLVLLLLLFGGRLIRAPIVHSFLSSLCSCQAGEYVRREQVNMKRR